MPRRKNNGIKSFHNEDLLLEVGASVDRRKWDENKYEPFIDELCGIREYQKEAIRTALRYLLGGEYRNLRELAGKNFERSSILRDKYGSRSNMEHHLQLPDQLAASLDLATGTGKSYVMYGIAAIMLAEGTIDRVLLLCPSTTIETGLLEKFELLAGNADLRDLLPAGAAVNAPRIINASESIVSGSICIENYHAILAHVHSSIRDSLKDKGDRTLILNDEAHHVANEAENKAKKWKEFLTDPDYAFRYIIGVSGTCYVGNEYFSDVIYRYSLRQAMEEKFVKKVQYVAEMPKTKQPEEEKWQLVLNRHEEIRRKLKPHKLRPLTIVITRDIRGCKDVAEKFKAFLKEETGKSREQIEDQVLVIHSDAPDLPRLAGVNNGSSKVEWILSVSMLNEGWDVKRVFQIVPHEKRAFESRLLIAQVLGRGLRVPDGWKGIQPEVTVFNHDKWADDIRHLVYEVMEFEKRIPTFPVISSEFNFELLNIEYDPKARIETYPMNKKYKLFTKGYVDLSTEQPIEEVRVEFEEADTGARTQWKTKIKHKTFSSRELAEVMYQRFEDLPKADDRKFYTKQFPPEKLEEIIKLSLKKSSNKAITDSMRQKFLQSLGTLQRKAAQVVRYDFEPTNYYSVSTTERPQESASASDLKNGKTLFYMSKTEESMPDEYKEFYKEAIDDGSGFKCVKVANHYDLKTPLNAVVADYDNERRFVRELVNPDNTKHIETWIKSTPIGFYEIDYFWKKGGNPKRGKFNPDFFIKTGKLILIIEIKDDDEINEPAPENKKKNSYALAHFNRINAYLRKKKIDVSYKFKFLTPTDFPGFFQSIRDSKVADFRSKLDVELIK
ncbi:MAG: DEAD/DEAH box helicase family protein [Patescibacteria group bacterium]